MLKKISEFIISAQFGIGMTILGVFLTIMFFIYQEWRSRKQQDKESLRLTEELVNLIIRNCINNNLALKEVDLGLLIDGFILIKNCKWSYSLEEILKMVYAKVYENEHISKEIRPTLLKDIEDKIIELEYESHNLEMVTDNKDRFLITPFPILVATVITVFVSFITFKIDPKLLVNENIIVILAIPLFLALITSIGLPKFSLQMLESINRILFGEQNTITFKEDSKINFSDIGVKAPTEEVKIESLTNNSSMIKEILNQKFILEKLIKNLYSIVFPQTKGYPPFIRQLDKLFTEGILDESLMIELRKCFQEINYYLHNDEESIHRISIEILINLAKNYSKILEQKIKEESLKSEKTNQLSLLNMKNDRNEENKNSRII